MSNLDIETPRKKQIPRHGAARALPLVVNSVPSSENGIRVVKWDSQSKTSPETQTFIAFYLFLLYSITNVKIVILLFVLCHYEHWH